MVGALITLFVYLLILGILWWVIDYALKGFPLPPGLAQIVRLVVVVIFALILIVLLLNLIGVGTGLDMPRLALLTEPGGGTDLIPLVA